MRRWFHFVLSGKWWNKLELPPTRDSIVTTRMTWTIFRIGNPNTFSRFELRRVTRSQLAVDCFQRILCGRKPCGTAQRLRNWLHAGEEGITKMWQDVLNFLSDFHFPRIHQILLTTWILLINQWKLRLSLMSLSQTKSPTQVPRFRRCGDELWVTESSAEVSVRCCKLAAGYGKGWSHTGDLEGMTYN